MAVIFTKKHHIYFKIWKNMFLGTLYARKASLTDGGHFYKSTSHIFQNLRKYVFRNAVRTKIVHNIISRDWLMDIAGLGAFCIITWRNGGHFYKFTTNITNSMFAVDKCLIVANLKWGADHSRGTSQIYENDGIEDGFCTRPHISGMGWIF